MTAEHKTNKPKGVSKRMHAIGQKVDKTKVYSISDAVALLKDCASAKFVESVDVSVRLGVDPRKSDQVVRGATDLPHGTGKSMRVAVFAQGDAATAAKDAGAELVGYEDLADKIKAGEFDFDAVIATPDAMRLVGTLGQILGPKGLMPNPKLGTVTPDVATAVKKVKAGQARYRTDKAGIIHSTMGKINFSLEQIQENVEAVLLDLKKLKPSSSKGVYIKKVVLSTTMGPGLAIDIASLNF